MTNIGKKCLTKSQSIKDLEQKFLPDPQERYLFNPYPFKKNYSDGSSSGSPFILIELLNNKAAIEGLTNQQAGKLIKRLISSGNSHTEFEDPEVQIIYDKLKPVFLSAIKPQNPN
jgi:hypothetical protein